MAFSIKYGDITKCSADAIVIPANHAVRIGGPNSVDHKIYQIAGEKELLEARGYIGEIEIGGAEVTSAFKFPAKYIIHAVSPIYDGGNKGEEELLRDCYRNSLAKAKEKDCYSIVFPVLSAGLLHYPMEEAIKIATEECTKFCEANPKYEVTIIKYSSKYNQANSNKDGIESYIRENTYYNFNYDEYNRAEREWSHLPAWREEREVLEVMRKQLARKRADEKLCDELNRKLKPKKNRSDDTFAMHDTVFMMQMVTPKSFDDYLSESPRKPKFVDVFCKFQREKNAGTDAEICKYIGIDQYVLTKMKSEERPAKRKVLWRLAIALKLNITETEELFVSCGQSTGGTHKLSKQEQAQEKGYEFFIKNEMYDIDEDDQILDEHNLSDEKIA